MVALTYNTNARGCPGYLWTDSVTGQGGILPASVPTGSTGVELGTGANPLLVGPGTGAVFNVRSFGASGLASNSNSFVAVGSGYTAYATPTDMIVLRGSDTKTIEIIIAQIFVNTTVAGLQTIYYLRRTTANTGGTATTPTPTKYDTLGADPTAVLSVYTAAPTLGTAGGNLRIVPFVTTVPTAAPAGFSTSGIFAFSNSITSLNGPVTLRGANESFCANFNGAALPAGFTAYYMIEWVEY